MVEGIMSGARVGTAFDRIKAASAMKVFTVFIQTLRQSRRITVVALSLGLVTTAMSCTEADRFSPGGPTAPVPSFAPVVQEVMPAVVNVSAIQRANKVTADGPEPPSGGINSRVALRSVPPSMLDELLHRFFNERDRKVASGPKVASIALG